MIIMKKVISNKTNVTAPKPISSRRKLLLKKKPEKLTEFIKLNSKIISEKKQLIDIHFRKLDKIRNTLPKEVKGRIKWLKAVATNTNLVYPKNINEPEPINMGNYLKKSGPDKFTFVNEKKLLTEELTAFRRFNKNMANRDYINSKRASRLLDTIYKKNGYNYEYLRKLKTIDLSTDIRKRPNYIQKYNIKDLNQLTPEVIKKIIFQEISNLQKLPPNRHRDKITKLVYDEIRKKIFLSNKEISSIVSKYKKSKNKLTIINDCITIAIEKLSERINTQTNLLERNIENNDSKIKKIKAYVEEKLPTVELIQSEIKDIKYHFPNIEKLDEENIIKRISELNSKIKISEEREQIKRVSPVLKENSEIQKYSDIRERAIILSKVERDLNQIVEEYA
jgi:hypothetical protein